MFCRLLQHAQGVGASVDFRVVALGLRDAKQCVNFRHQLFKGTACAQHLDKHLWLVFHQGAGDFFPATLRRKRLQFA
ncbi:hypothetical protein D3C78_1675010 [compost metagenome]